MALIFLSQQTAHTPPPPTALAAAVWADQSGPPVQAVLLGSLSRKNFQTLPERHFPDAQKELSFLSLGSLMVSPEQLHRINILRFEPLRVGRVILAGPVSSALSAEKPWLASLTLNSRLCHTPSQMGRAGKRSLQINFIEALLGSWAYIQSFL